MGVLDSISDGIGHLVDSGKHAVGEFVDTNAHVVGGLLDAAGLDGAAHAVDKWGDSVADSMGVNVGELGLGTTDDPTELVHGDVKKIHETADHLNKFHTAFEETGSGLTRLDHEHWQGAAADAFRAKFAPHPPMWLAAAEACGTAAAALSTYAATVEWAQAEAKQAIETYKSAKQASEDARSSYRHTVDEYNRAADHYNRTAAAGGDPGPPPTRPGEFHDPGQAGLEQAVEQLRNARKQRDAAAQTAAQAVHGMIGRAPAKPSFLDRLGAGLADSYDVAAVGYVHLAGGIVKGGADLLKFARGLNFMDPYNLSHPAQYMDHLSTTVAGLVTTANHPVELGKALVGSGWGDDPFEAGGKLIFNIGSGMVTGGSSEAGVVVENLAMNGAKQGAVNLAERGAINAGERAGINAGERAGINAGEHAGIGAVPHPAWPEGVPHTPTPEPQWHGSQPADPFGTVTQPADPFGTVTQPADPFGTVTQPTSVPHTPAPEPVYAQPHPAPEQVHAQQPPEPVQVHAPEPEPVQAHMPEPEPQQVHTPEPEPEPIAHEPAPEPAAPEHSPPEPAPDHTPETGDATAPDSAHIPEPDLPGHQAHTPEPYPATEHPGPVAQPTDPFGTVVHSEAPHSYQPGATSPEELTGGLHPEKPSNADINSWLDGPGEGAAPKHVDGTAPEHKLPYDEASDPFGTKLHDGTSDPAAGHHGHDPADTDTGTDHHGESGHKLSAEEFQALSVDQRMAVAEAEISPGARTFESNEAAAQYGAQYWNDYATDLPKSQADAVRAYTEESNPGGLTYHEINGYLRSGNGWTPELNECIKQMDEALAGHVVPEDVVVTRGTDLGHITQDPREMVGKIIDEHSYTSTSLGGPAGAFSGKEAVLHLRVPEGTPGLWVEKVSAFGGGERELILGRGRQWRADRVVFHNGQWHVFGEFL
ncbi:putative T7SS-secreted protein [Kitasatospora sp. NPDC088134]|uniref:putative T7SS-secreted protein n=1 Tax=Kitasatospora sp. NPDC088134 TaxID=3364071 RepID=UPI0038252C7A